MYLLDTSVISYFDRRRQALAIDFIEWTRRRNDVLFLSVMSMLEIEAGFLKLIREDKLKRAEEIAALRNTLLTAYDRQILVVTTNIALETARLIEAIRPRVIEQTDLIIAATAKVHNLTVLTRNLRHFTPTGVPSIDPLLTLPPS